MGTRADFYVGRGPDAEWLGSIAMDGYPDGRPHDLLGASSEAAFRAVVESITKEGDGTRPADGWPWPWDDSKTTDYAYAFDGGRVWTSCFGCEWYDAMWRLRWEAEHPDEEPPELPETAVFPDMSARKNVTYGKRSGLLILTARKP